MQRVGKDQLLELLLARRPDRVIESVAAAPEDMADLVAVRGDLVELASSAPLVQPSPTLRERLLGGRPRPLRPQRPVVIVLDMINDHLRPGGPLEVPRARDVVPALTARLADARRRAIPVVYVCDSHQPDDPDYDTWPLHALEGSDGAAVWPELAPEAGDRIVKKPTYSAFARTELTNVLAGLGADQIILTGCATEIGVQATAVDALELGYVVTIPPDCQAGMNEMTEMATLLTLATMPPYDPIYLRARRKASAGSAG
jgi:nicotinamidase-related amidase